MRTATFNSQEYNVCLSLFSVCRFLLSLLNMSLRMNVADPDVAELATLGNPMAFI